MATDAERLDELAKELRHTLASISGHAAALRLQLDSGEADVRVCKDAVSKIATASARALSLTELLRQSAPPH
jgi:hypothetical protein